MSATVIKNVLSGSNETLAASKMPVLFLGHGSPMNALAHNQFTADLRSLGESLPKPKAILAVSAHWLTSGTRVEKAEQPKTIHDFYGFPEALYKIEYPAKGSPETADRVLEVMRAHDAIADAEWGLDHGTWSVLRHMYPKAEIPVLQLSINRNLNLRQHLELAKDLKSLRDQGVLIVGSGNVTHNLYQIDWDPSAAPFDWAQEYDELIKSSLLSRNMSELLAEKPENHSLWKMAHPSIDHYIPLLYTLGASDEAEPVSFPHEGIQHGSLSMRAVKIGA